ncbi:MAG TPA: SH3 domain-containing protein [Aggregatilineales bacterium]|nr:SH3 domain-containing protein [Aggregatilineales bacterium]
MTLKRQIATFILSVAALLLVLSSPTYVSFALQAAPLPIIDAAYKDLSTRLGKSIVRGGDTNWSYEVDVFTDTSLGCPQPGKSYAQSRITGYKIIITYPRAGGTDYDYRANNDGSVLFLCNSNSAPASAASPTPAPSGPVASQSFNNPFAFVGADGNVTLAQIGNAIAVPITTDSAITSTPDQVYVQTSKLYSNLTWSPDGTKLAFMSGQTLFVAASGNAPVTIVQKVAGAPAWSSDSSKLAYFVATGQPDPSDPTGTLWQGQAVSIAANGSASSPQYAGTISFGGGCGGGGFSPSLVLYYQEAGYAGNPYQVVWTNKGFVYTMNCVGMGLALRDSTGKVIWQVADAGRVAISPDRSRAAAVRFDKQNHSLGAIFIDLATGATTPLSSDTTIDQFAWSADGSTILYSKQVPGTSVSANASSPFFQKYNGAGWLGNAPSYTTTLWRMPAAGGQATQLLQRNGFAIGVIAAVPDNSGVLVSFVPAMTDLANAINANGNQDAINAAIPKTSLVYIPWNGGTPVDLAPGGRPAFAKGSFTAVPASGGVPNNSAPQPSGNVTPPNLVIGGKAVVITSQGKTLNLRRTPGTNADVLGILNPGTVVTVEAGPQVVDGLRWWKVITVSDSREGWVVDQVTDSTGTTNTLSPQ